MCHCAVRTASIPSCRCFRKTIAMIFVTLRYDFHYLSVVISMILTAYNLSVFTMVLPCDFYNFFMISVISYLLKNWLDCRL